MTLPLLTLPLFLGACSSLFFDDEELAPQRIQVQSQQAEDPGYPNLASVPEQVPRPSPSAQRQELAGGLSADRQHARYSDQPLTPEGVAAEAGDASDQSYPPPPALSPAQSGATVSQTAATVPPPPQLAAEASDAGPAEPAMPLPPAAPSAPPASESASESASGGQQLPEGFGTLEPRSAPAEAPTGLLQERAFQQQAAAAQRLQQIAAERRAFDEQARQQAIEQQWQREQLIQQHQAQWRYPMAYQQQAAVPPAAGAYAYQQQAYPGSPYPAAGAVQVAPGQLVGLIYFGHGSARLDARDREVLQQVMALQQSQGRGLRLVGHASARAAAADMAEHQAKNQAMSMRRAQAVADALVSMGADGSRIDVGAAGDAQPVYHEFTSTGEAGNRRVEIFLE
ncbi:MAG: OmpA family protein [Kiloniellales bacterium]